MGGNFGFTPENQDENEPDGEVNDGKNFAALFQQFANFGINPQTLFASGTGNNPLISTDTIRDVARKFLTSQSSTAANSDFVSVAESDEIKEAFNIANLWLDEATYFPSLTQTSQPAWSRRDWMDSSLKGWQRLVEPLAEGMASALTNVLKDSSVQLGSEFGIPEGVETTPEMFQGISMLLRSFMGSMIATQLGQSIGLLATSVTGSHDVAIPLYEVVGTHLIPLNIKSWGDGLDIPESEVRIFLALREAAAARLFTHTPWLTQYVNEAFAAYGKGIKVDLLSIQEQAENAVNSGELDINNPDSITSAISQGLFTPEQSPEQDTALAKLEMILALIDGWIDHIVTVSATDRIPSLAALNESIRRRRASNSPTQQLFATLLGLEVSPRMTRESASFWAKVLDLRGFEARDARWEDPALLPTAEEVTDAEKFLQSTTVPDDLSGLI